MDTTASDEKLQTENLTQRRGDIERLWLEGLTTHEIAAALGMDPRSVGQNLRALRNRRARAAARQQEVVAMTQCATIVREAMEAWERSKKPKVTTTVEEKDGQPVRTVTREVEGPGDKGFLLAALNALKTLRRFAPEKPPKTTEQVDVELVELLQILTPEQVERFTRAQLTRCRQAVDARKARRAERQRALDARNKPRPDHGPTTDVRSEQGPDSRRDGEASREAKREKRRNRSPHLHAAHQTELPGELASQDVGGDARPRGGGRLPAADGFHAAPAWQERTGEPPLPGLHAGPQPEPPPDRGQPYP